jgi:hypothetical protein
MFGQADDSNTNNGAVMQPIQDNTQVQLPPEHQMTPAYPADDQATSPAAWVAGLAGDTSPQPQFAAPEPVAATPQQVQAMPTPLSVAPVADDTSAVVAPSDADHELLDIKQDALSALSPLVGQLEQTPEEKFRTTMMMIQASDDRTMVKAAYEAAQSIPDEKVRAQALLDVINEINYFTSHLA